MRWDGAWEWLMVVRPILYKRLVSHQACRYAIQTDDYRNHKNKATVLREVREGDVGRLRSSLAICHSREGGNPYQLIFFRFNGYSAFAEYDG